jgi:hypothetical protein
MGLRRSVRWIVAEREAILFAFTWQTETEEIPLFSYGSRYVATVPESSFA